MNVKKIGLLVLTLIVGLIVVSVVSAQSDTPDTPEPPPVPGNPPAVPFGRLQDGGFQNGGLLRELFNIVAADLGMEPSDILQQMRGQTLADVITANGGDVDAIAAELTATITDRINQAVADGNLTQERADQVLANLADNVQKALSGEIGGVIRNGLRGRGQGGALGQQMPRAQQFMDRLDARMPLLNAIMDATGLNGRDLAEELQSGSTLSDVITAHGGDPDAVVADAIAKVTARLDEAVANGNLTTDQKQQIIEGVQAFYDAALTATRPAQTATPASA